jgi:hypothetical protein
LTSWFHPYHNLDKISVKKEKVETEKKISGEAKNPSPIFYFLDNPKDFLINSFKDSRIEASKKEVFKI